MNPEAGLTRDEDKMTETTERKRKKSVKQFPFLSTASGFH
jgi:hypothetical protein